MSTQELETYEEEARQLAQEIQAQIGGNDGEEEKVEEEMLGDLALRERGDMPQEVSVALAQIQSGHRPGTEEAMPLLVMRRRIIERFLILGYDKEAIAEKLKLPRRTVESDIKYIQAEAATMYDVERIRLHVYSKYQRYEAEVEEKLKQLGEAIHYEDEKQLRRANPALLRAYNQMLDIRRSHAYDGAKMYGVPTTTVQHKVTRYTDMLSGLRKIEVKPKE